MCVLGENAHFFFYNEYTFVIYLSPLTDFKEWTCFILAQ